MYVCNAVMYETLGHIKDYDLPIIAGFLHVPLLKSQNSDGMELETMIEAVIITINTSLLKI